MSLAISLDEALLLLLLVAPLTAFVIGVIVVATIGRKHLRQMNEMAASHRAMQDRIEQSMRRGARMTEHRMKL